jgi:hypothetical protein
MGASTFRMPEAVQSVLRVDRSLAKPMSVTTPSVLTARCRPLCRPSGPWLAAVCARPRHLFGPPPRPLLGCPTLDRVRR